MRWQRATGLLAFAGVAAAGVWQLRPLMPAVRHQPPTVVPVPAVGVVTPPPFDAPADVPTAPADGYPFLAVAAWLDNGRLPEDAAPAGTFRDALAALRADAPGMIFGHWDAIDLAHGPDAFGRPLAASVPTADRSPDAILLDVRKALCGRYDEELT